MGTRVCALVEAGAANGRNPVLTPLRACLAERGVELTVWDPTRRESVPLETPQADLYLVKGDHPNVLTVAGCLADAGAPLLNSLEATALCADKVRSLARVTAAGVRVPASTLVGDRESLAATLTAGKRIVKPVRGAHGSGVRLLGPGQADAAGPGPWLVQSPVGTGGPDLKVYGVGERAQARRATFVPGVVDMPREPLIEPPPGLLAAARVAARACGLVCWGADFLLDEQGPVLVDVNAFPGYRTVDEAPLWIADEVCRVLRTG